MATQDKVLSGCILGAVETLSQRIQWILDNCEAPGGGKWDAKALSKAAGLADAHVGMMRRGTAKKVRSETIEAVARAAGVSHRWLATGQGSARGDEAGAHGESLDVAAPVFEHLPEWPALREMALGLDPTLPPWAIDVVGKSNPLATAPITAGHVAKLARIVVEIVPPPAKRP